MTTIHVDAVSKRPYVPLAPPLERYHLTLPNSTLDPPHMTRILSQPIVSSKLTSVREPHSLSDAVSYLALEPHCNDEVRFVRDEMDWKKELKERIPFTVIRDSESGELKGTVTIRRNMWEWLNLDQGAREQRDAFVKANEALPPGDPDIIYSIGT